MVREPAVAGQFYKGTPDLLSREVQSYILDSPKERVIGAVCPHAGLMYSGHVAGAVYSRIELPDTLVLIGPNHTGLGSAVSIYPEGRWIIPTGSFDVDEVLAHRIYSNAADIITKDTKAHLFEHSLEVQLPFIAFFKKSVRIVPIVIMQASVEECRAVGEAISDATGKTGRDVMIVASSDMSHYVSDSEARILDKLAIDRIVDLDPEGLYNTVVSKRITMCGYMPVAIMLYAALGLGATHAELVGYATSGEVSGDYDYVVGYAGIVVK